MFYGSIVALVTPFTQEGEVDYPTLENLVEQQINAGTDAVMCCGTTGESPTLSHEEHMSVIRTCVETACKRVPVIAGTGSYDTRKSVQCTKEAQKIGADGCLAVVPYYSRPTPEGCIAHFNAIANVGLPMIVYYHPGRTGVHLSPTILSQIAEHPSVVGIKETSGDIEMFQALKQLTDTPLLTGDDLMLLSTVASGGAGVISVVANLFPKEWKECVTHALRKENVEAVEIFEQYKGLCHALGVETNPHGVKYAMGVMGKCLGVLRLPLVTPRAATRKLLEDELSKLNGVLS